uniref:ATP synthase complex subunit 8 n=1 Tax=Sinochlora sinensis TaxID=472927 RepID=A0A7L9QDQ3_9ORTH|nr:ATP synthase F0 subunit 8 [Sinochlora sinensis]
MPQMSPLWWLFLFILFLLALIMNSLHNYFLFYHLNNPSEEIKNITMSQHRPWKW